METKTKIDIIRVRGLTDELRDECYRIGYEKSVVVGLIKKLNDEIYKNNNETL
jgi:hypothetical protein